MFRWLAALTSNHPWRTTLAVIAVAALAASGIPRVQTDLGLAAFVPEDPAVRAEVAAQEARWGRDDLQVVVLVTAPRGDLLDAASLATVRRLREAIAAVDGVVRTTDVTGLPRLVVRRGLGPPGLGDLVPVDVLSGVPAPDAPHHAAWRAELLADPVRVPGLLGADGSGTVILAELSAAYDAPDRIRGALDAIRAAVADTPHAPLDAWITGVPAIRVDMAEAMARETRRSVPWILGGLLIVSAVAFARPRAALFPIGLALASVLVAFGLLGWSGRPFGHLGQAWVMLLPVIAVADAVHLAFRIADEESRAGPGPAARAAAYVAVGSACLVTSVTTAIGVLSLATSRLPAIQAFAVEGAAGVALAFALFALLGPVLARGSGAGRLGAALSAGAAGAARLAVRAPWSVVAIAVGIGIAAGFAGSTVEVDYRLTDAFASSHPTSAATREVERRLGGVLQVSYELTGAPGVLTSPALLSTLDAVARATTGERELILSTATVARRVLEPVYGARWPDAGPDRIAAVLARLDPKSAFVDASGEHGRVILRTPDTGARAVSARAETVRGALAAALAPHGVQVTESGTALRAYRGLLAVSRDLATSLLLAVVLVALVIGWLLRSARLALVSLPPNLLPLVAGWGFLGVVGWPLQIGTAVVFTLGFGLAVDDTTHLLHRWRHERAQGHDPSEAAVRAARSSGTAVVVTTALVVTATSVLAFSDFRGIAEFGALATVVMLVALAADLLLLPALLAVTARYEKPSARPPL